MRRRIAPLHVHRRWRRRPAVRLGWREWALVALLVGVGLWALVTTQDRARLDGIAEAIDGDSLRVAGSEVRLHGIDAVEYGQTCQRAGADWACGREAARRLAALLRGGPVACVVEETDRYGRAVATCRVGETDLARVLVAEGFARALAGYHAEEAQARAAGRGIWAGPFQDPADFRAEHPRALR